MRLKNYHRNNCLDKPTANGVLTFGYISRLLESKNPARAPFLSKSTRRLKFANVNRSRANNHTDCANGVPVRRLFLRKREKHTAEMNVQGGCCQQCCLGIESIRVPNEKSTLDLPTINIASKADHDRVIATILMGFSSDPLARWFWPEANTYLLSAPGFDAFGGNAVEAGTAFVSAGFEGAALWLPPGIAPEEERMAEILQKTVAPDIVEEVFSVFEKMDGYHPAEDVWYLPLVAVDPAHQGKGIGSALMKAALQRCDEAGFPAYLESSNPRNVSLYERHGFEVMGQIQVGSSPIVTPMYRPAR